MFNKGSQTPPEPMVLLTACQFVQNATKGQAMIEQNNENRRS